MRWTMILACAVVVFTSAAWADSNDSANPAMLNMKENPTKVFPAELLQKRISGSVLLQFRLDEDGKPQNARVVLAEPKAAYESTALEFISHSRFSVPPEWVVSHPNRIFEFGIVFLVGQCQIKDLFPGITSVTFTAWPTLSAADMEKVLQQCEQQRDLQSTIDRQRLSE